MASQPAAAVVRRLQAAEWSLYRDLRLHALADSPDAFGSTLAAEASRPAAQWAERLEAGCASAHDLPLVAEIGEAAVGLAWGKADPAEPSVVNLYQMWVTPQARGQGLGRALLRAVVAWSRVLGARSVVLGVASGESPAWRLYAREGFVAIGEPEPLRPGSDRLARSLQLRLTPPPA